MEAAAVIQVSDAGGLDSGRGGGTLGGASAALGNELTGLGKEGRRCFYFAPSWLACSIREMGNQEVGLWRR